MIKKLQQLWDKVRAEKGNEKAINDVHKNSSGPHIRTHFPFVQGALKNRQKWGNK